MSKFGKVLKELEAQSLKLKEMQKSLDDLTISVSRNRFEIQQLNKSVPGRGVESSSGS